MKTRLDFNRIARGLGAIREGRVAAKGGYFGAMQVLSDVVARFRVPPRGGRATDPGWTERRLIPLAPQTLKRLEHLTTRLREHSHVNLEPMQLAGLLLERTTEAVSADEAEDLIAPKREQV